MNIGSSFQHPSRIAASRPKLCGIFALAVILLFPGVSAAQQSVPSRKNAQQSSKTQPQYREAQELFRQGFIDQAKEKIEEELKRNPSSVEAYNLLGIICSDQKDYTNALEAFQHALKLDANSTRTRNNLGKRIRRPRKARSRGKRV